MPASFILQCDIVYSSKREKPPQNGDRWLFSHSGVRVVTWVNNPSPKTAQGGRQTSSGSSVLSACVNERKIAAAYVAGKTLSCNQRRRDVLRWTRQHCDAVSMPRHFLHVSKSESILVRVQKAPSPIPFRFHPFIIFKENRRFPKLVTFLCVKCHASSNRVQSWLVSLPKHKKL